eukprot:jgi/Mesvir1/4248/Mv22216-RA.1
MAGAALGLGSTLISLPDRDSRALAEESAAFSLKVPGIYEGRPILPSECPELYTFAATSARKIVGRANAPVVLRLAFHDAFTFDAFAPSDLAGGPNASIKFETDRPENKGLKRALRIIDAIQKEIEDSGIVSEVTLSKADLIAIAGAEAVAATGGPEFTVPVGRVDASGPDPEGRMPMENMTAASLKARFASSGYSVKEMVCLSGAHTLGTKGFGKADEFDNAYFVMLKARPWENQDESMSHVGIDTDRAIAYDPECLRWINYYAASQNDFWADFAKAYTRMVTQGAKWICVNPPER